MNPLLERGRHGKLPSYSWPGGYPMFYMDDADQVLCPDCANEAELAIKDNPEAEGVPIAADINWEDLNLYCDECGEYIDSAYAEKAGS